MGRGRWQWGPGDWKAAMGRGRWGGEQQGGQQQGREEGGNEEGDNVEREMESGGGQWGRGDGKGAMRKEVVMGRGRRRFKRLGDFTDGYDGMPG